VKKIREWLSENDDKIGKSGKPTTEAGMELPDADLKIGLPGNGNTFKRTFSTDSFVD